METDPKYYIDLLTFLANEPGHSFVTNMMEEVVRETLYTIRRPISGRHLWHSNVSTTKIVNLLHFDFDPHGFQCQALLTLNFILDV